jgi:cytoskeletal protein RodZ
MTDKATQDDTNSLTAPGKLLRDQRELIGITQAEVAARMRLSQQAIKDIEADDYTHFSAAIYVRGYIRNYAAIVELEAKPLLEAFDVMGFVDQLNQTPRTSYIASSVSKTVRLHHSRRRIARWMSYLFFVVIIALVAVWWHGQRMHKHAAISANILSNVNKPVETHKIPVTVKHEVGDAHVSHHHVTSERTKRK